MEAPALLLSYTLSPKWCLMGCTARVLRPHEKGCICVCNQCACRTILPACEQQSSKSKILLHNILIWNICWDSSSLIAKKEWHHLSSLFSPRLVNSHSTSICQLLMLRHFLCIFLWVNEILNKDCKPERKPETLRSDRPHWKRRGLFRPHRSIVSHSL